MSNRKKAFDAPSSNPSTKFIEWSSNDKKFKYYDKSKQETVFIDLPFKFLAIEQLHTVSGWHDASQSGIYSNEVKYISKEPITVKSFKGPVIATGLYKDVKESVKRAGGHYVRSIYIMLDDGSLANLSIKGSVVQAWGEFTKANNDRLTEEWIEVSKFEELKKGSIKYTVPLFNFKHSLSESQSVQADRVFDELEAYLNTYFKKESEPVNEIEDLDDLDF